MSDGKYIIISFYIYDNSKLSNLLETDMITITHTHTHLTSIIPKSKF